MNPNLAALLFFSPFLIMFFSFMFWIFREEKRRERLRKKWNEDWKEEVRELEEIERRTSMNQEEPKSFSFPITDTNIIQELDSLTPKQVEELNRILEEGLKELREKHK